MFNKAFFYGSLTVVVLSLLLFVQNRDANEQIFLGEIDYSKVSTMKETVSEHVLQREPLPEYSSYEVSFIDEYLCGTTERSTKMISAYSIEMVRKQFAEYALQKTENDHLTMKRTYYTIHPQMFGKIYFGLNAKNELVIAHKDETTENPLKVFFPLEIHAMEISLPKQQIVSLKAGIPVNDNADYYNILSTFSEYIIDFPYGEDMRSNSETAGVTH